MRLVIARCTVDYQGRLAAHLPEAIRLIMVKADGCVAIHADGGAYKPLNWMNAPNKLSEDGDTWTVTNPAQESLTITVHEIISDSDHDLGVDPGLVKDGVEAHLQELLAADPTTLGDELELVRREYPTDIGPVDLVALVFGDARRPDGAGRQIARTGRDTLRDRRRRGEAAWRDRWCRTTGALPRAPRT